MKEWKEIELGEIGSRFYSGGTPSTKDNSFWNGEIYWITSKWLDESTYLVDGEKKITKKGLESSASKLVPKESIIIATRVGVGKVSINKIDLAINQDLLGIEIDSEKYSLEFLVYQLRTQEIQNYIKSFKRGATIQGVTRDAITSIRLKVPPLSEQRKIACILNTLQKAIEQQDKLIKTTIELKKALMQKLFTEGTKGEKQKQTEIGLLPESWDVKSIDQITVGKFQNGAFVQNPIKGKGILFANVVDMYRGIYLDFNKLDKLDIKEKEISQYILEENDILFVRSSLKREGIGQNCVAKNIPETTFYDCHIIKIKPKEEVVVPEFLSFYFNSPIGKEELIKRSKTTTMTTINQKSLGSTLIPLPEIEEQKEIVRTGLQIDKKNLIHELKKITLSDLLKTMLHELMSGQRRVNEINFENIKTEYKIPEEPLSMAAEN